MTTPVKLSTQEIFQQSWGRLLANFRQWILADTVDLKHWQSRPLPEAIRACPGRMIDDAEAMLAAWRKNENVEGKTGSTALLPAMLTAFEPVASIPDIAIMRGVADWIDVQVTTDEQERIVRMRTIPTAIRAQIAIFTANPHAAFSLASQFCQYLSSENNRRMALRFHLGGEVYDDWQLTIIDNTLFPSRVPTDAKNLTIATVDVTLNGLVPHVVGLGGEWDATTDPEGTQDPVNLVVVEADIIDEETRFAVRWVADPDTGDTTLTTLTLDQILMLEDGQIIQLEDGRYVRLV